MIRLSIALFTFLYFSVCYAADVYEIQEVRLAKAELALGEGREKEALKLIARNLQKRHFHLESFLFLANYFQSKGEFSKSFRVYHYIIKKFHSPKILKLRDPSLLPQLAPTLRKPTAEALTAYFELAKSYFKLKQNALNKENGYSEKHYDRFLFLSVKYFQTCNYYKFNLKQTNYYLGILYNESDKFQKSLKHLLVAKDKMDKNSEEDREQEETIDYFIADNLVQEGFNDAGSLYLKSVYLSPKANKSLKEYANNYVDSLNQPLMSLSGRYNYVYNSNIHLLTDSESDNFSALESSLYREDAYFNQIGINFFYNSKRYSDYWSFLWYLDLQQETATDGRVSDKDTRYMTGSFEMKFDNLKKSITKLAYTYTKSLYKLNNMQNNFSEFSDTHSLTLKYSHSLRSGYMTYKLPWTYNNAIAAEPTTEIGLGIAFTSYFKSRYFAPSVGVDYTNVEETDQTAENSTKLDFILSNQANFSDFLSNFVTYTYTINSNNSPSIGYKEHNFDVLTSFLTPWVNGLSLNNNIVYQKTDEDTGGTINVWKISLGLSYSL